MDAKNHETSSIFETTHAGVAQKEKEISQQVRKELLEGFPPRHRLLELDNIKGYREVRYKAASLYLGKKHV